MRLFKNFLNKSTKLALIPAFLFLPLSLKSPTLEYYPKPKIPRKTIVIDPGHGGKDFGHHDKNILPEKEINLNIAKYLKPLLEKQGYKVLLTRNHDILVNVPPRDHNLDGDTNYLDEVHARKTLIEKLDADYFLSLHNNANKAKYLNGLEIYVYGYRYKNERTNRKTDYHTPKRAKHKDEESYLFAQEMDSIFNNAGFKSKINCADFGVLEDNPSKKSIIIEYGYLTNEGDRHRLESPDYQKYCAQITAKYFLEKETSLKKN